MQKKKTMIGWYFSRENKKLGHGDNRIIKLGQTHKIKGNPVLCKHGLHASKNILGALSYAQGPIIWKVKLFGKIVKGDGKSAAQKRLYLEGGIDITVILRKFARMCALDVVHLWKAPEVVIEYLKTGKEESSAAARAAGAAASAAAWAAAWAASAAASAAAWDAAGAAAMDAASAAAGAAAMDAAMDAAGAAARAALGAVAWGVVGDAAWDVARAKQNKRLNRMVHNAIKKVQRL